MTSSQSGIHVVQPATSSHSQSERDRLIGKPRFHFEPQTVMQLLGTDHRSGCRLK